MRSFWSRTITLAYILPNDILAATFGPFWPLIVETDDNDCNQCDHMAGLFSNICSSTALKMRPMAYYKMAKFHQIWSH